MSRSDNKLIQRVYDAIESIVGRFDDDGVISVLSPLAPIESYLRARAPEYGIDMDDITKYVDLIEVNGNTIISK